MSWDHDPYAVMEVMVGDRNQIGLHCHNCGMERWVGSTDMTLLALYAEWLHHVRRSHVISPADTAHWSAPGKRYVEGRYVWDQSSTPGVVSEPPA